MPAIRTNFGVRGPIVEAHIGVSEPQQKWMRANGVLIPPPIPVQLLVDTGADTTTIAEMHMRSLGIQPTSVAPVRTITSGVSGQECNVYPVSLQLVSPGFGDRPHAVGAMEVLAQDFFNEGIDGLIGRDLIVTLRVTIDGPNRRLAIEWP